ncbi:MAG TPA: hypothetical protein VIF64_07230 [Pyrinomonadaceae bacterium]|jgi:hypothetical protein
MKRLIINFFSFAIVVAAVLSPDASASQRRRVVVMRHPQPVRRALVVHRGYPIRRVLPGLVVVRPTHGTVVVRAPLVYLPAVAWTRTVVVMPPRERLVWQDSEIIEREEGWVDSNFGVDSDGNALFLDINGNARLNFAEVTFANGNVQVVDFNEQTHGTGIYKLLDFADGRHVSTVRILAKSESDDTKLAVYLSK